MDIGSTTSHVMLARLRLQRLADALSSRYVVVERAVIHRSPIVLTPYRADGLIDADSLGVLVSAAYTDAAVTVEQVDTGAVILTGTALERPNAKGIAELFAAHGGRFVCASAGHRLEALLAAHGSGAVARSRDAGFPVLNIDIGGGTTKLALCVDAAVVAASALAVGARHVPAPVDVMAEAILDATWGRTTRFDLLPAIAPSPRPAEIVVSGGVSEHLYGRDRIDRGDLGIALADAVLARRERLPAPIVPGAEGIRATVVGASQFSVQLSGSTIFLSDPAALPVHNVPVLRVRPDAASIRGAIGAHGGSGAIALAIDWRGEPSHRALRVLAEAIAGATGARRPLVVALESDIAHSLGRVLTEELGLSGGVVVVDGLELRDLDYVDIGEVVRPAGVVPVIIKSLVFGS